MDEKKIDAKDRVIMRYTPDKILTSEKRPVYTGEIEIALPNLEEKYVYLEQMGISTAKDVEGDKLQNLELKAFMGVAKRLEPHFLKINITRVSNGKQYTSFGQLFNDMACEDLLTALTLGIAFGGFANPGNDSSQPLNA